MSSVEQKIKLEEEELAKAKKGGKKGGKDGPVFLSYFRMKNKLLWKESKKSEIKKKKMSKNYNKNQL